MGCPDGVFSSMVSITGDSDVKTGARFNTLPKLSTKIRKSGIPISPSTSRSYFSSYCSWPSFAPNTSTKSKKSGTPTVPLLSKSGEGGLASPKVMLRSIDTVSVCPPRASLARTNPMSVPENVSVVRKSMVPIRPLIALLPDKVIPIFTKSFPVRAEVPDTIFAL